MMTGLVECCAECSCVLNSAFNYCNHPKLKGMKVIPKKDYQEGIIPDWCPLLSE